jgi:hypothetical protein
MSSLEGEKWAKIGGESTITTNSSSSTHNQPTNQYSLHWGGLILVGGWKDEWTDERNGRGDWLLFGLGIG